jgi:peptide deformylase
MCAAALDDLVEIHGTVLAGRADPNRFAGGRKHPAVARRKGFFYIGAMIRPILIIPDPRLKRACDPVTEITPEIGRLAEDMLETMYLAPGVGLAAPQVGVTKRLLVMDCVKDPEATPRPMVLINPVTTWASEDVTVYEEGCLSIPDQYAEIERPAEVRVRWTALDGTEQEEQFAGLWSTCVQHEMDHLDGKLFIDYLRPLRRQMIVRKMEKLKRDRAREAGARDGSASRV